MSFEPHILRCVLCGQVAATFSPRGDAVIYVGVLGKRLRTERISELDAVLRNGAPAELERFMQGAGWLEVQADDVTPAYTIGEPGFNLDAYCVACDRIHCKDHVVIRRFANAGYGEWIIATCPNGHERKVYDDYRGP